MSKPWDDRTVRVRHRQVIRDAVHIYCEWLNGFQKEDLGNRFRYTVDHFLSKEENRWADTRVDHIFEDEEGLLYIRVTPYDGDDGGAATLFIHADRLWELEGNMVKGYKRVWLNTYQIRHIGQTFDTYYSNVFIQEDSHGG